MHKSQSLFAEAQQYIPGGVNSPVRAFHGVSGTPLFFQRGQGAYLIDVDGRAFIDYVGSWGPLIAGHAHPTVVARVTEALQNGLSFGASTEAEVHLAKTICHLMPAIERVRFVSSGTEAAMSAIRLARGFTQRNKIIKFAGCYHGHADSVLVAAGSGALTLGAPSSAGVPLAVAQETLVAEFNQLEAVKALFARYGQEIAAVIVEPVAGNMNLVFPTPSFLPGLRALCDEYGSVLIFDEVITGFRVGLGGAQAFYQVTPDLTILGKVIGGGLPVAAFGGKEIIMRSIAPLGPVYQAGTLSGNPIAMAAGLAMLDLVSTPHFYEKLSAQCQSLVLGLQACAQKAGVPFRAKSMGGMFGLYFESPEKIETEADVKRCNVSLFKRFFHGMLEQGIYFAPSAFEVGFVSEAHQEHEINQTLSAATKVFATLSHSGDKG